VRQGRGSSILSLSFLCRPHVSTTNCKENFMQMELARFIHCSLSNNRYHISLRFERARRNKHRKVKLYGILTTLLTYFASATNGQVPYDKIVSTQDGLPSQNSAGAATAHYSAIFYGSPFGWVRKLLGGLWRLAIDRFKKHSTGSFQGRLTACSRRICSRRRRRLTMVALTGRRLVGHAPRVKGHRALPL